MSESSLRGVEIFGSGSHRGKTYGLRDLDDMVENFKRFSCGPKPKLRVPGVLGHDEDQVSLRGSGLAAAAWCENVYRDGNKLKADFADVPPQVMRLLQGKVYRTVSSEIYDDPPEGLSGGKGKMLRRVAFLGGDIPQVKSLEEIPVPEAMSERFARAAPAVLKFRDCKGLGAGVWQCFSEVQDQGQTMDIEKMMAALQQMGADTSLLQGVPDAALAEILRVCDAASQAAQPQPGAQPDMQGMGDGMDPDAQMPDPANDQEKAMYAERAMKLHGHAKKFWEKYRPGQKFGEDGTDTQVIEDELVNKGGDKGAEKMSESERQIRRIVTDVLKGSVQGEIATLRKFAEDETASRKKSAVDAFCESRLKEGKILPYELDPANPTNVKARLYRADSRRVVTKFTENGRAVELTELDLQQREIDARKPFKFGEVIRPGKAGGEEAEAEAEKVTRFSEDPRFGRALEAAGKTPADYVRAFAEARKSNPALTAAEYGVPA